jgi:hypothetical protein
VTTFKSDMKIANRYVCLGWRWKAKEKRHAHHKMRMRERNDLKAGRIPPTTISLGWYS